MSSYFVSPRLVARRPSRPDAFIVPVRRDVSTGAFRLEMAVIGIRLDPIKFKLVTSFN